MCGAVCRGPSLLSGLESRLEELSSPPNNLSLLWEAAEPREVSEASDFTSWASGAEMEVEVLPGGAFSFLRELLSFPLGVAQNPGYGKYELPEGGRHRLPLPVSGRVCVEGGVRSMDLAVNGGWGSRG